VGLPGNAVGVTQSLSELGGKHGALDHGARDFGVHELHWWCRSLVRPEGCGDGEAVRVVVLGLGWVTGVGSGV